MPSLKKNSKIWNQYSWPRGGDEWSDRWGGTENLWKGILLPRIHNYIPAETILEIAPGFGRCTQYLKECCDRLILVDISSRCIEACKQRFPRDSHIAYYVNDGKELAMIEDRSIDFAFSFDSLVHAEPDVLQSYLNQLARKLKLNGCGFIHHSNLGSYPHFFIVLSKAVEKVLPFGVGQVLRKLNLVVGTAGRGRMTADLFIRFCAEADLQCTRQELINWTNGHFLIDSFSTFTNQKPSQKRTEIIKNPSFLETSVAAVRPSLARE